MNLKVITILSSFWFYTMLNVMINLDKSLAQEPLFELPVQLIGFPVIILSVRLSNFAKKLAYSLSPSTYKTRTKRGIANNSDIPPIVDVTMAEKKILSEFGPTVCVLEEPCETNALRSIKTGQQPNWNTIIRNYKVQSTEMKQWYLLSVFLGDIIKDTRLCKHLAKQLECGRS